MKVTLIHVIEMELDNKRLISGLIRLQDVLQINNPLSSPITVRQLGDGPDYRPLLKEILMSGETRLILDCSVDKITDVLRQAKDVKMMEEYQVF